MKLHLSPLYVIELSQPKIKTYMGFDQHKTEPKNLSGHTISPEIEKILKEYFIKYIYIFLELWCAHFDILVHILVWWNSHWMYALGLFFLST